MNNIFLMASIYAWVIVILIRLTGKQLDGINSERKKKNPNCRTINITHSGKWFNLVALIVLQSAYLGDVVREFMNNRYSEIAAAVTLIMFVTVIPISLLNAFIAGYKRKWLAIAALVSSFISIGWYILVSMDLGIEIGG